MSHYKYVLLVPAQAADELRQTLVNPLLKVENKHTITHVTASSDSEATLRAWLRAFAPALTVPTMLHRFVLVAELGEYVELERTSF